jgi:hypothetical protein
MICWQVTTFLILDKLIHLQYDFYHQDWISDGKPNGYFWRPPELKNISWNPFKNLWLYKRVFAFYRCSLSWIVNTPKWISNNEEGLKLLSRYRWLVLSWNIGLFSVVVIGIVAMLFFPSYLKDIL